MKSHSEQSSDTQFGKDPLIIDWDMEFDFFPPDHALKAKM